MNCKACPPPKTNCLMRNKLVAAILLTICAGCTAKSPATRQANKAPLHFSSDWFSSNIPKWDRILKKYKDAPNISYLELGVFEGRSYFWMLENIVTDPSSRGVAVDSFDGEFEKVFQKNLSNSGVAARTEVVKKTFVQALPSMKDNSFDIVYLDGGHMSWTTLETAMLVWPKIKPEGVLIFDDYGWKPEWPSEFTPKLAVDAFVKAHRRQGRIIQKDYQVFFEKTPTACDQVSRFACTPIGEWAYDWEQRTLTNVQNKKVIALTPGQTAQIEKAIRGREGIDDLEAFQKSLKNSAEFIKLVQ